MEERNLRKTRIAGLVTSNKMAKTVTVAVEKEKVKHPIYGKFCKENYQVLHAHDDSRTPAASVIPYVSWKPGR